MAEIFVGGKKIIVEDEAPNRPPPSRVYEPVHADLFNHKKMVEDAKQRWKKYEATKIAEAKEITLEEALEEVPEMPKALETLLKDELAKLINETIELESEKIEIYRNFTKQACRQKIEKYQNILIEKKSNCKSLDEEMKTLTEELEDLKSNKTEEDINLLERIEDLELEVNKLHEQWLIEDQLFQKYSIILEDYQNMEDKAKE